MGASIFLLKTHFGRLPINWQLLATRNCLHFGDAKFATQLFDWLDSCPRNMVHIWEKCSALKIVCSYRNDGNRVANEMRGRYISKYILRPTCFYRSGTKICMLKSDALEMVVYQQPGIPSSLFISTVILGLEHCNFVDLWEKCRALELVSSSQNRWWQSWQRNVRK